MNIEKETKWTNKQKFQDWVVYRILSYVYHNVNIPFLNNNGYLQ